MCWSGVFSGVAGSAIAVLVWSGAQLGAFRAMYAGFGAPIPTITQVVIHPGFQWGAPAVLLAALLGINLHGRRHTVLLGVLAAVTVAAAVVQYWGAHLPITQVAGAIR